MTTSVAEMQRSGVVMLEDIKPVIEARVGVG